MSLLAPIRSAVRPHAQQWLHALPTRTASQGARAYRVTLPAVLAAAHRAPLPSRRTMATLPGATIPRTQRAAIVPATGADLQLVDDHPVPQPADLKPGECLVKLDCTGVCHTDLHAARGDWPVPAKTPLIGGHEGVGIIVAIGEHTDRSPVKVGDRVGIKWLANACGECEFCRKGLEQVCPDAVFSGFTVDGTFSEYVRSFVRHVTPIPENLDSAEAASILCAGLTVYRAIKYSGAKLGDWIVLPGAGGGLGHLAVQYANAAGLRVLAIDTGRAKQELVMKLGAEKWIDFKETKNLVKDIQDATGGHGPNVAVVTAATSEAYSQAIDYLRPGGTLMVVGLPASATLNADIFFTVTKSINILGSYVGNRQDAYEALDIAASGKVKCFHDLKPLSALKETYEAMEKGTLVGRVVLDMKPACGHHHH